MSTEKPTEPAEAPRTENNGTYTAKRFGKAKFSDEQKITAVSILRDYGTLTPDALKAIHTHLGDSHIAPSSIYAWVIEYGDRVDSPQSTNDKAIVQGTGDKIITNFQQALMMVAERMIDPTRLDKMTGKDLMIVGGILYDKLRDMGDMNIAEKQAYRSFRHRCLLKQIDPITALNDYADEL